MVKWRIPQQDDFATDGTQMKHGWEKRKQYNEKDFNRG
jgi:hypothetical protein